MRPIARFVGGIVLGVFLGLAIAGAGRAPTPAPRPRVTLQPNYPVGASFRISGNMVADRNVFRPRVAGVIVNHHLLAPEFISDTLQQAYRSDIDQIILLAPNHFFTGFGQVTTIDQDFQTPFGIVPTDRQSIQRLIGGGSIVRDEVPYVTEHGIFNILPFLRQIYPHVPIIPIITKDTAPDRLMNRVTNQLAELVTSRTLIIASLDFAHNQTITGAEELDEQMIKKLVAVDTDTQGLNHDGVIAVDSPPTLRLFLTLLRRQGATTFTLTHHSNSAEETGSLTATNVTSHITGLYSRQPIVLH